MRRIHSIKSIHLSRRQNFTFSSILSSISILLSILSLTIQLPKSKTNSDAFLLPAINRDRLSIVKPSSFHDFNECPISRKVLLNQNQRCRLSWNPLFVSESTDISSDSATDISEKLDVPMPTDNGGYSHTAASKAKISAANKGKTPWNKGKARSEEVKKRIAEGVRRKNRERFLKKLEDMGLTEEEYEQQKKEERRKKDAERRARRTENGGYRPTEETRQKISRIMKEKFANGEIKRRTYNGPSRKGFTHSEETKEKIRQSLRKKWAEDTEYQAKMRKSVDKLNTGGSRQKISKTLKEKWKDPEFRKKMMKSMENRKTKTGSTSKAQREKISAAMKKKWQDEDYRNRTMKGMENYRKTLPPRPARKQKPKVMKTVSTANGIVAVTPMKKLKKKARIARANKVKVSNLTAGVKKTKKKKTAKKKRVAKKSNVTLAETAKKEDGPSVVKETSKGKLKDDGDISRMREERRDLYDLLYGDDGASDDNMDKVEEPSFTPGVLDIDVQINHDNNNVHDEDGPKGLSSFFTGAADLDDDNLDDFDPYNLDDY